jgi:hypothetical protein
VSNQTFMRAVRPVVGIALLAALAALVLTGSARAERPGWFSPPSIVQGEPTVGSTLAGSDGALRCDPACEPAGPDPSIPGRYFQWLSCADKHGGGKAAPAGGLPDEGGPCPGAVIIKPASNILKDSRAHFFTVRQEDAGRHIQMEVIAKSYDCGEVVREGEDKGKQECRYVESHAWSSTIGPIVAPGPPPPPPPPPVTAPTYTALPEITGAAEDMQTLTVSNGTWNGTQPLTYEYKWLRCSRANNGCKEIEGATESTYTLTSADIGARLTASVTVRNAGGSFTGIAKLTAKVAGAKPRPGRDSLGVDVLLAPRHHLRVQSVAFTPALLRPGGRWVARVTVTDARGFYISGAEVSVADELGDVTATPVLTNARGVATVRLRAARFLPLGRLVLEVTAASPENEELTTTKRVVVRVRR